MMFSFFFKRESTIRFSGFIFNLFFIIWQFGGNLFEEFYVLLCLSLKLLWFSVNIFMFAR